MQARRIRLLVRPPLTRAEKNPARRRVETALRLHLFAGYTRAMKLARLLAALGILLMAAVHTAAQTADDRFIQIYRVIKQADDLNESGQPQQAYGLFREAQTELKKLQASNPSWNPKVVQYRLNYVGEKLSSLAARVPESIRDPKPASNTPPSPSAVSPSQAAALAADAASLRQDLQRLQNEKSLLEAKLREALLAQPAAVDPREVAKAEDKVRLLQKENDVLRITIESQKSKLSKIIDPAEHESLRRNLAEAQKRLGEQERQLARRSSNSPATTADRDRFDALRQENEILKQQLAAARTGSPATEPSSRRIENLEKQLKLAQSELAAERASNATLRDQLRRAESETAEARKLVKSRESALADLEKEKESIQRRSTRPTRTAVASPDEARLRKLEQERTKLEGELTAAREDLKQSQQVANALKSEKSTLESKLAKSNKEMAKAAENDSARIRKLEKERDELIARLEASKRSKKGGAPNDELARVKEKLDVIEARKVPFTPEELALFKEPAARVAAPAVESKPSAAPRRALPSEAAPLIAEAQRAFQNRRLDEAEQKYQQVLKIDSKNASTLANLAVVQMEQNRLDEAEKHLNQAVAETPEDARNWSLLGILRFRQKRFDDALDALSRSAKMDAGNAETQNYLGITLSEKGQRIAAEAALRRAIQIQPGYGNAHHNLAIIYATQKPPFAELARWHYQKSISAGHPRNDELEKVLENAATTAKTP